MPWLMRPFKQLLITVNPIELQEIHYRRGEQTDAMGRLMLGPMDADGTGEGLCVGIHTNSHTHTQFTQVQGPREEVKPVLLLV